MNRLYARRFKDELHEEYPDLSAAWYALHDGMPHVGHPVARRECAHRRRGG
jgi:hypothetical protein